VNVWIKKFDVEIQLKNNGVELAVYDTGDKHRGDLVVTKTQVIWCEGKTSRANGKSLSWNQFIDVMRKA